MPFDDINLKIAMKNVILNENWTDGDADGSAKTDVLFAEIRELCGPSSGNHLTMGEYITKDWFESLCMWIMESTR